MKQIWKVSWLLVITVVGFAQSAPPRARCEFDQEKASNYVQRITGQVPVTYYFACQENNPNADATGCIKRSAKPTTRPGGFGKADVYIAFKKHGKWATVKNLGPQINGPDSEYNPAVSTDGKTLFFGRNSNIYEVPVKTIHTLKSSLFR